MAAENLLSARTARVSQRGGGRWCSAEPTEDTDVAHGVWPVVRRIFADRDVRGPLLLAAVGAVAIGSLVAGIAVELLGPVVAAVVVGGSGILLSALTMRHGLARTPLAE
ncbi:MAG: hypothetical protein QM611_01470 [Microbacterium sp.]|uniref:hypothetical protein n=1 Tax=Microbacterium sp. TaxID=51671 RepID=UPI0039E30638